MVALDKMRTRGELRHDEPMSRHTSWRAGGNADLFFIPSSVEDLQAFLRDLDAATPIFWLGVGSNLLVRDGGIRGVVVSATGILKGLDRIGRAGMHGQNDDFAFRNELPKLAGRVKPVQERHRDIHENQIRLLFPRPCDALLGRRRRGCLKAVLDQQA